MTAAANLFASLKGEEEQEVIPLNPFSPTSAEWHLQILLCLTPDKFTRQWGTP